VVGIAQILVSSALVHGHGHGAFPVREVSFGITTREPWPGRTASRRGLSTRTVPTGTMSGPLEVGTLRTDPRTCGPLDLEEFEGPRGLVLESMK